jgi:hypothetical protein
LRELDKLIDRVKLARLEYSKPEIDYVANFTANSLVRYYCDKCSNQDAELFISDNAAGDTICMECGNIVDDHHIDHGQEKRNFEDKEVFMFIYVYISMSMYVCVYICMCMYMNVFICIYERC